MAPIVVRCTEAYQTEINIRQHTIVADELIQDGGTDIGPTPMEILVGTLGACIAVTTRAYAQRKGWPLEDISVEIEMERIKRADHPSYNGDAPYVNEVKESVHFGGSLTEEQKEHLLKVAAKCPVHMTMEYPTFFVEKLI